MLENGNGVERSPRPVRNAVGRGHEHELPPAQLVGRLGELLEAEVVEEMKARVFRKDLFVRESRRLGAMLAERMEDAEGWHDASRIEPAKESLRG